MINIRVYKRKFKEKPTTYLIKHYDGFNSEFRGYAREEFRRRKVKASSLPYKKRVVRRTRSPFGFGF